MQTITKIVLVVLVSVLSLNQTLAQTTTEPTNSAKIEALKAQKEQIKVEERELLKAEVEAINKFKRNQVFFNEGKIREKLYNRQ